MRRHERFSHVSPTQLEMVGAELALVALLAAFFNPPDPGVTAGEFEYVQRVVDGDTLLLGTGERVRLADENN
jgi:hypothetical protein